MDSGGESIGCCFPTRKESRHGARWIVKAVDLVTESSGYESRQAGASAGAVNALAGPGEVLILSVKGEAGKRTAAASEAWPIRGLTATTEEAGRVTGACAVLAVAGTRDRGCFYTQRAEGGNVAAARTRGEAVPMPSGAGVAGRSNPKLFVSTTEGQLPFKHLIRQAIKLKGGGLGTPGTCHHQPFPASQCPLVAPRTYLFLCSRGKCMKLRVVKEAAPVCQRLLVRWELQTPLWPLCIPPLLLLPRVQQPPWGGGVSPPARNPQNRCAPCAAFCRRQNLLGWVRPRPGTYLACFPH